MLLSILPNKTLGCVSEDTQSLYFNLFTQNIITDKSFTPFLYSPDIGFYHNKNISIPDENLEDWQRYFDNKLSYEQIKILVYKVGAEELKLWLDNDTQSVENELLNGLDRQIIYKYYEGLKYLVEAKYLQPYMRVMSKDNLDWGDNKDVTSLNYTKIINNLMRLYKSAEDQNIKLRYAYQLVRFYHYNLKFNEAVQAFKKLVEPLNLKTAPYYLALEQYAGALKGRGEIDKANYLFLKVFQYTKRHKDRAYSSINLSNQGEFNKLLQQAKTDKEREMIYFLLAYQSFNDQLPIMEKIVEIDPNSEILKILQTRVFVMLEKYFLEKFPYNYQEKNTPKLENRLPLVSTNVDYDTQFERAKLLTQKIYQLAKDKAFWGISLAYFEFLKQNYINTQLILEKIDTENKEYQEQIDLLNVLSEIVAKDSIDADFEDYLVKNYSKLFNLQKDERYGYSVLSDTSQFIISILANRYFIQGEKAKSFLMQHKLSDVQEILDYSLIKDLDYFYNKKDKNLFEKQIIMKNVDVEDPNSLFSLLYGDFAMRNTDFSKAYLYYLSIINTKGIIPENYEYEEKGKIVVKTYKELRKFDKFNHISLYVFGNNKEEHFNAKPEHSMQLPDFINEFSFIHSLIKENKQINKLELANILGKLQEIAENDDEQASKANQLLGNLMYNTSKLGYFRHLFVSNLSNAQDSKYFFYTREMEEKFYYGDKKYGNPDAWHSIQYAKSFYQKALELTDDKERQAEILFQLASIEQGDYYQWAEDKYLSDKKYLNTVKNNKYRHHFNLLKDKYSETKKVQELQSNCAYFKYFMTH